MRQAFFHLAMMFVVLSIGAAPTTRQSQQRVNDAIKALRNEFDAAKDLVDLREQSNYFTAQEQVAEQAVLEALEDSISREPVRQCYVKWQLLSAVDGFDATLVQRAIAVYRDAPPPILRPGISDEDHRRLDALAAAAVKSDVYDLTRRLEAEVEKNDSLNRFILAYRDELYRKLPKTSAVLLAALEDLFERFQVGAEIKPELAVWMEEARQWSKSSDARPAQMRQVAEAIERLLLEDGPQYYYQADYEEGAVRWKKKRDSLRRSPKLKQFAGELRQQAEKPAGGLKFRDE